MTAGLFPDVADVMCDLLAPFAPAGQVGLITPVDLTGALPFIRVGCIGGSDDRVTDSSTIDVEVFAASITAAGLLSEQIRQFLTTVPHLVPPAAVLDRFAVVARPRPLPWPTPGVFRSFTTYRASARRMTA